MQALSTCKRIMFKNILLTTDFSVVSAAALPYAAALTRQYGGTLFTVHAIDPEPHLGVPLDPLPAELDSTRLKALKSLNTFIDPIKSSKVQHVEILERGDCWPVILDAIKNENIDLVFAGTHGRHGIKRLVLGSTAEQIFRHCDCPVITVGPRVPRLDGNDWKPKRILFPTDGSEASLSALPYALSLADENEASLLFLQLLPFVPNEYREGDEAIQREALRKLVPADAEAWCTPEFIVRFDFPGSGIVRVASERDADLIVMSVRRYSENNPGGRRPWAVSSQVVREARCPVLTVRS